MRVARRPRDQFAELDFTWDGSRCPQPSIVWMPAPQPHDGRSVVASLRLCTRVPFKKIQVKEPRLQRRHTRGSFGEFWASGCATKLLSAACRAQQRPVRLRACLSSCTWRLLKTTHTRTRNGAGASSSQPRRLWAKVCAAVPLRARHASRRPTRVLRERSEEATEKLSSR